MAAELIQIYYREEQKKELYPFAIPYYNEGLTIFFENSIIADVVLPSNAEKIGVCSWKLRQKQRWNVGRGREITEEVINSDYDVLSFTRNSKDHEMLNSAEVWHPGFKRCMALMLEKIGVSMPSEVKNPINQNHFMALNEIYTDYVTHYLIPAMGVLKNDPACNEIALVDSHYTELAKKDAASPERLTELIGIPYYPMAPFLLERLFPIYCHNKKINVTYI